MEMFSYQGVGYSVYGGDHQNVERDVTSFLHYVNRFYRDNGVVFAVVLARLLLFTEARFQWQRMINGRPGDLFGTAALDLLERPWPNGTTGDLLARMEQDASLHGNFYAVKEAGRIRRLRPDWVEIVLDAAPAEAVASNIRGYLYRPGGNDSRVEPKLYLPHEMAHWAPIPDPLAQYRGMSWITPVIREVVSDRAASEHKLKFFENAATPNLAVSFSENITQQQFQAFMSAMNAAHQGSENAYKTMYLGGGADVKVIGSNMEQMDFKNTQGAGETRICAAGGVPPIIVGLSEGLSSATYSNYGMARRKFGDHWARPQWRSACAALSNLIDIPHNARLWYDDRDIAFLREDQKDVAAIQTQQASTMKQLIDAGYQPESVTAALMNEDWSLLEHSGLYSVQLQPPGTQTPPEGGPPGPGSPDDPAPPATPQKPRAPSGEPENPQGGPEAGPTPPSPSGATGEPERGHVEALVGVITRLQDQVDRLQDRLDRADARHFVGKNHPRDPKGQWTEKGPGGTKSPDPAKARPTTGVGVDPDEPPIDLGGAPELDTTPEMEQAPAPAGTAWAAQIRDVIANESVVARKKLSGGANADSVELVTFEGGTQAVIKRTRTRQEAVNEVEAARVGDAVGARVADAILSPDRDNEVITEYVPHPTALQLYDEDPDFFIELDDEDNSSTVRMGLLDVLINNLDRHEGNFMVDDGEVVGIDHGDVHIEDHKGGYNADGDPEPHPGVAIGSEAAHHFLAQTRTGWTWGDNPLTEDDVDQIRAGLAKLEDQGVSPGAAKAVRARFEAIAKHAGG